MDLYPAIDLLGGRCVRLYQGDYDRSTTYGDDPVAQARAFEAEGAPWIHVVDLDAARSGDPVNRAVIGEVARAVDVPVQTGGGVRDLAAAEALFEQGVERVVVGTAALEDPDFVRALAARRPVAVGLDGRGREVAVRGWTEGSGRNVLEVAEDFADAGVAALVVTEIGRDGTLEGPDNDGLSSVLAESPVPLIASGGVGTLADIEALAAMSAGGHTLEGVIVGRALYEGAFGVAAAVASCGVADGSTDAP
ncbi:MAG: 1-(5-phosphoribosyl)-5-[(5-phosphoribosylamino)methylideneamino]imidazole-4-carboxamide isomerase [Microthrixaceae bacterium]